MEEVKVRVGVNFSQMQKELEDIFIIWDEIGIDAQQQISRTDTLFEHLFKKLMKIKNEEAGMKDILLERIKNYKTKIEVLSQELHVPVQEVIKNSLINLEEALREILFSLTEKKQQRMKKYESLQQTQLEYCKLLDVPQHKISSDTGVPTERDLEELEVQNSLLKTEEKKQRDQFEMMKKELLMIWESIGVAEKELNINEDLSQKRLKLLEQEMQNAKKKKNDLEAEKKKLMAVLEDLWERLKVEEAERAKFRDLHLACTLPVLEDIQTEISKYKEMKRLNAKSYLISLRDELQQLWDKCYVSKLERQVFSAFVSPDCSDDIVEAHENEITKWKEYFASIEHIAKKIEKRKNLWALMKLMDAKAADPARFKNRKGNLLQEERDRKKLQKDLPALEKSIFQDIELYEKDTGYTFEYYDSDFQSFVQQEWEQRLNEKENTKAPKGNQPHSNTPMKKAAKIIPGSAPSKLKSFGLPIYRTPTPSKPKVHPSTSVKVKAPANTPTKAILKENNENLTLGNLSFSGFTLELNKSCRNTHRSTVLTSKKRAGTRTSRGKPKMSRSLSESEENF